MKKNQLKKLIEQTLIDIGYAYSTSIILVQATIAQESHFGRYIHQIRGPAEGIGMCEPDTFNWMMENFIKARPRLLNTIKGTCNIQDFNFDALIYNLKFAICMVRVRYLMEEEPLPESENGVNLRALYGYYKKYYNSYKGAATWKQFKRNYKRYVK